MKTLLLLLLSLSLTGQTAYIQGDVRSVGGGVEMAWNTQNDKKRATPDLHLGGGALYVNRRAFVYAIGEVNWNEWAVGLDFYLYEFGENWLEEPVGTIYTRYHFTNNLWVGPGIGLDPLQPSKIQAALRLGGTL